MNLPKKTTRSRPVTMLMEMFGLSPTVAVAIVTLIAAICLLAVVWFVESAPPRTLTVTSGPAGSSFQRYAERYQANLAKHGVTLRIVPSEGSQENLHRLDWSLSRIEGYVGATGAIGSLRGERFAAADRPMRDVLQTLSGRGLLYVDPRPGASLPERAGTRTVDLVIDTAQQRAEIERRLHELERIAQERGSALGLAGLPLPVTIGAIAAWAAGLEERGFVLAPVSALVAPPSATASPSANAGTERGH